MIIDFPSIDPVALALGPLQIRWYALAYLAGFVMGWRYCLRLAGFNKDARPNRDDIDDVLTWIIVGVIAGGRLGYVLFYNPLYYFGAPLDALKIWHGGMSFHGGAIGVIVAMILYARVKQFSFLRLADIVCAAVPIGLFFGRIANFINAELYGRVTNGAYGVIFPNGGPEPRHPSQLYEAALEGAVLFLVLLVMMRNEWVRNRPGIVAGSFLVGYGVFRFVIEFFREPDVHIGLYFDLISQGQVLCIPMVIGGLGVIAFAVKRTYDRA